MKFKVISFDLFQTLVDVNQRIPQIWQAILKEEYTSQKAAKGARAILTTYPAIYERAVNGEAFQTMEEVYTLCAKEAMDNINFRGSARDVAYHIMYEHSKAPFYREVLACIQKLHQRYRLILSSDSNHLMVDNLLSNVSFDGAFISDDIRSYKGDRKGRFFDFVLSHLHEKPEEMIHIGDSYADIIGANRAGMASCWINRENRKWSHAIKPDYTVRDLNGLAKILE